MKNSELFRLSVNSITHRKLRSWLTLLGIIIGVAAVVSIISIGEGAQASVNESLSGFGADILTITPGHSRAGAFGGEFRISSGGGPGEAIITRTGTATASSTTTPVLTKNDASVIRGNQNILSVTETVSGRGAIVFLAQTSSVSIEGVNPNTWRDTSNLELASGRYLTASDSTAVVIGDRIANSMFKQPITLGRTISIEDKPFTVVGILKASGTSSFGQGGSDSTAFMSLNGAWEVTDVNKGNYSSILAKAISADDVNQATTELTQALMVSRRVTSSTQDFTITSAQSLQAQVSSVAGTLTLFLAAIAAVSLIVGAVGVANSLFTSVLEKTKLIGILKALGSTNKEIMLLFVIESGLFGLVGGIIGVILGTIVSIAMSSIGIISLPMTRGGTTTFVSPQLVVIAIVLSTVIGIVSGILPARQASKLKPVEALRYE